MHFLGNFCSQPIALPSKFRRGLETPLAMPVRSSAGGPFRCYSFSQEVYLPELLEIGLDLAVQGVPFKKKLSVSQVLLTFDWAFSGMRIPPFDFVTASARWTRILSSIGMNRFRAPDAMAAS